MSSEPNHERALVEANVRFRLVVAKYELDKQADMLTDLLIGKPLSCEELIAKVGKGMTYDDANDFLRWIAIGIKFKEESIDPHSKNPLNKK